MARSHHNNKNIDIENAVSQTVRFDKQQLPENYINKHEMSGTPKPTKEQEHESSFRRKLLNKHITSQTKDPDLVRLYTDLGEYLLSQVITSKETLEKEWENNLEEVWDWVSKLISTYDFYTMDCNRLEERLCEQNESNTGLKLELKATRAQSKDAFDYLKKKSHRIERLKTVID